MPDPDDLAIEALGDELDASPFDWLVMKWTQTRPRWRVCLIDPQKSRKWTAAKDEIGRYDADRLSEALRQAVIAARLATYGPDTPSPLVPDPAPTPSPELPVAQPEEET